MGGMHTPQSSTVLQHAIEVAELARPALALVQRRDCDLASQLRRAIASIALNVAEAQGNAGGNTRVRYESALGSLYETRAAVLLAVAWGYASRSVVAELLGSLDALGGRVFGLAKK
jgi:four helix bundle protein